MMINTDVDCDKVNEILRKKKKKKRSSRVQLSEKAPREKSSQIRGIENPLVVPIAEFTMPELEDVPPSHSAMHVTTACDDVVTHN